MKNYTVYSTVSKDGMLRMALHPMDSAPTFGLFHYRGGYKTKWPFRVVYLYRNNMYYKKSCRGADSFPLGLFCNTDDALEWLVEGEKL